ncbi:hypothetical protein CSKR_102685 [Clonorchis sinensis]|uniref:Uncharacterized protein n=1 Tax=Clonorchis sinensis TaxID=79923 RepID=A0A3R7FD67_CLOSI|nr:hypothetical protein CSKR_102685 [Clonorchis sinensis]
MALLPRSSKDDSHALYIDSNLIGIFMGSGRDIIRTTVCSGHILGLPLDSPSKIRPSYTKARGIVEKKELRYEFNSKMTTIAFPLVASSLNPALMMSPRLVMKRLQSNCQARRTDQQSISAPELPIFHNIADAIICSFTSEIRAPTTTYCISSILFCLLSYLPSETSVISVKNMMQANVLFMKQV